MKCFLGFSGCGKLFGINEYISVKIFILASKLWAPQLGRFVGYKFYVANFISGQSVGNQYIAVQTIFLVWGVALC